MRRRQLPNSTETTVLPAEQAGEHQSFFGGVGTPAVHPGGSAGVVAGPADPHAPRSAAPLPQGHDEIPVESESIVLRVRRHGRHLTLPVSALVVIAGCAGYFIGWFAESWMNIAAAVAAFALAMLLGVLPILAWLSHRTVITTRRVISHRGFLVRHRSEVSLARVREVKSRQTLVQRMFRSGDVKLFVGAESTTISDAPDVTHLHASLQELSERNYDEHVRAAGRFGI